MNGGAETPFLRSTLHIPVSGQYNELSANGCFGITGGVPRPDLDSG